MDEGTGYRLRNDIIDNHSERMQNLKKYYPFFYLQSLSLGQFKEGRYVFLDMGYITMALLRFLIEENNLKEQEVTLKQIYAFLSELLQRDFALKLQEEEEEELLAYLFDKIRNDGRPFQMEYFDPADRKQKIARMKLIESGLSMGNVIYFITADAIEFYLDTKEIREESKINIEQLLLEKLIQAQNFKGGIEVVRRVNSEVNTLRQRKKEVLMILGYNIFEGVKALEEFNRTGIRWFKEEQEAFRKNSELIEAARRRAEAALQEEAAAGGYPGREEEDGGGCSEKKADALYEISLLDSELNRAMVNHGKLLADCMELQVRADEIIHKYKFSRLRNAFDFRGFSKKAMEADDASVLSYLVLPLLAPHIRKSFSVGRVDDLLCAPAKEEEIPEEAGAGEEADYRFEDEVEEERIDGNYRAILKTLLDTLLVKNQFSLKEFNEILEIKYFDGIFQNSDYYSFLVHLCQKREYDLAQVKKKQDTFLEGILARMLFEMQENRYRGLSFRIELLSDQAAEEDGKAEGLPELSHSVAKGGKEFEFKTSNIRFIRET